jgi:hypothetical protein
MNYFILALGLVGVILLLIALWRARTSNLTIKQVVQQTLQGAYFIFVALCIRGFNFSPLQRGASILDLSTPALLGVALFITVPEILLISHLLQRLAYKEVGKVTFMCLLLIGPCNVGIVQLVNGALDFTPPIRHIVTVAGKRSKLGQGTHDSSYYVYVTDWNYPGKLVKINIRPSLYRSAGRGTRLEVEVGSGFLGAEWIRAVRF